MITALASGADVDFIAAGRAALDASDPVRAVACFQRACDSAVADWESRYWLYTALAAAGQAEASWRVLDEARNLHAHFIVQSAGCDMVRFQQQDKAYCAEIGLLFYNAKMMGPASLCLGRALDFDALNPNIMLSYGLSLQHQGRVQDAIDVFTLASQVFDDPVVHEFLLQPVFIAQMGLERLAKESRNWGERFATPQTPAKLDFANSRTAARPLRIGYIGPSFTRNQVAQFLLPVLESHDPEAVQVHLYCDAPESEAALPSHCATRKIAGLRPEAVARMVREDRIDILVDVWGHNAGSRLPVFGYRPAPVQVAWINFVQSTGLSCMDYVLHCDGMDIPGTDAYFTEERWSLGELMSPSRPSPDRPDPTPTPALKNGYVTYGSFNNPAKLNEMTVAAWSLILRSRPQDRLVLKYSYYDDPVLQRATRARFAVYGAQPEQIEFRGHSHGLNYLREFQDIDLALDPSPCVGGTTTHDALANGVPVLCHRGDNFYARAAACTVLPLGIPELVADGWDEYVDRAVGLTDDVEALDRLRARIRPAFDGSSYRDEASFTRKLEAAFRQMYCRWLAA